MRSFARREALSQTITPPRNEADLPVPTKSASLGKPSLGEIFGNIVGSLFAWVGSAISNRLYGKQSEEGKSAVGESEHVLGGVSGVVREEPARKEMREIATAGEGIKDEFGSRRKRDYFGGRPMISDEVTLPQKRGEKDQYEQVLVERIALNPRDVEAYERLGDYYMENENLDDAKECFKQVLRLSPLSRRARFRMRRIEKSLSTRRRPS